MVRKAGTVHGGKIPVGQGKVLRVLPVVRNLLRTSLRVSGQSTVDQVKAIHLAAIHGLESTVPAIAEASRIHVGQRRERDHETRRREAAAHPVSTAESAEVIIEGVIFLKNDDRVLNR